MKNISQSQKNFEVEPYNTIFANPHLQYNYTQNFFF